jgi:fumarate hydratase class II
MNVNKTAIETDSFGPVEVPAMHYLGAQTQRSLGHFAIGPQTMPLAIAGPFRAQRLYLFWHPRPPSWR